MCVHIFDVLTLDSSVKCRFLPFWVGDGGRRGVLRDICFGDLARFVRHRAMRSCAAILERDGPRFKSCLWHADLRFLGKV